MDEKYVIESIESAVFHDGFVYISGKTEDNKEITIKMTKEQSYFQEKKKKHKTSLLL